ncbi:MAG: hypothetical protein WCB86_05215 [Candidatus Dormiibacterota bacterium]
MQIIHITALGARTYLRAVTGQVGGSAKRQAMRRGVTGSGRGPIFSVREFWLKDVDTGLKVEAKALPADFPVRNGQQATLVFKHFGRKSERLLAVRNNSSGDYLVLPSGRPVALSILLWIVLGWIGYWVGNLLLTFDKKPGLIVTIVFLWLVGGLWYFFHGRAFQMRLRRAMAGGPDHLALMVDR